MPFSGVAAAFAACRTAGRFVVLPPPPLVANNIRIRIIKRRQYRRPNLRETYEDRRIRQADIGAGAGTLGLILGQFVTGLASAASLFLIAAGLSIIFGVTRIVNFAHGSFYMLGAYIAYSLIDRAGGGALLIHVAA